MPTYQYACTACGHRFEQVQSFTDDALTECPQCGGRLRKVFNAVGVVFKGSGFHVNDYSSNGKSSGHSGKKIGNAHLRWAFGEAVVLMLKGNKPLQALLQRMASKHGKGKALAILSHRLGRTVYYMLKNQVPFDQERFLRKAA